jgi:uncharacterized FAD-dependent dehydrogenase
LNEKIVKKWDVITVGGGPAGLFAALELARDPGLRILVIEKGMDIDQRTNLVSGLGGAGAFSDGKLILSPHTGGRLTEYLPEDEIETLIKQVDKSYRRFGAPQQVYGTGAEIKEISHRAAASGLRLVNSPVRHLGTDHCRSVLRAMRDHLTPRVEFRLETKACRVIAEGGQVTGVEVDGDEKLDCEYLILAPGREGADWLSGQAKQLGLTTHNNPVDVGVRVEVPASVMAGLTDPLYEAKLEYLSKSFGDRIRTFCMCPSGEVITETTGGDDPVITVNGQSYADRSTDNTNFAVLVSTDFTRPFHEPIAYGKYLARLANILSGGVLVQRLGDLLSGHRSTPERMEQGMVKPTLPSATPGDVSFVLPYRHLTGIVEMLQTMDKLVPGLASADTLLYGIEVKFYSYRPELSSSLETEISNLFCIGDGAGVSRGLIQASASGVIVAREITKRKGGVNNETDR